MGGKPSRKWARARFVRAWNRAGGRQLMFLSGDSGEGRQSALATRGGSRCRRLDICSPHPESWGHDVAL